MAKINSKIDKIKESKLSLNIVIAFAGLGVGAFLAGVWLYKVTSN